MFWNLYLILDVDVPEASIPIIDDNVHVALCSCVTRLYLLLAERTTITKNKEIGNGRREQYSLLGDSVSI